MKKSTLILFWLLASCTMLAQTKAENESSNAEKFGDRSGTLIQKTFLPVGSVKEITVQVVIATDINSNATVSSVRVKYEYKSSYSSDTKIAVLDSDEIDGLLKSLDNIEKIVLPSKPSAYTEVVFRSRTGFEAGVYYREKSGEWVGYFKIEKFDSNSSVLVSAQELLSIRPLLLKAKTMMQ